MCSNILTGFLSLKTPGTVTIAPVTSAPVPTADGIAHKEGLGGLLLLLILFSGCWDATWIWAKGHKAAETIIERGNCHDYYYRLVIIAAAV